MSSRDKPSCFSMAWNVPVSTRLYDYDLARNDAAHARVMWDLFQADQEDLALCDLVLNTAYLSVGGCIDTIKRKLSEPAFQETPASRARLLALKFKAQIRARLRRTPGLEHIYGVCVDLATGKITLTGAVAVVGLKQLAERIVSRGRRNRTS